MTTPNNIILHMLKLYMTVHFCPAGEVQQRMRLQQALLSSVLWVTGTPSLSRCVHC